MLANTNVITLEETMLMVDFFKCLDLKQKLNPGNYLVWVKRDNQGEMDSRLTMEWDEEEGEIELDLSVAIGEDISSYITVIANVNEDDKSFFDITVIDTCSYDYDSVEEYLGHLLEVRSMLMTFEEQEED